MYKIATLNKISPVGLGRFTDEYTFTEELAEATGILVRSQDMTSIDFSDHLLAIARAGAGVNNIPVDRCSEAGIVVFNTPGANANAVKELVISALFLASRNLPEAIEWTKTLEGDISGAVEKGKAQFAGSEIKGKTLGIIGLGSIGVLVANAAEKLGMRVIGYDPFITVHSAHELSNKIPVVTSWGDLLPKCDYVSIHVPVMESTKGMINKERFAQMNKNTCLLNFSRANLVNREALFEAIDSGIIKKYITDFPNDQNLGRPGVICIPHLGASTEEAEENCAVMAADQLIDYLENGNITNSVNFPNCTLGPLDDSSFVRICILNKNIPAMLGKITGVFAEINVNISDLVNRSKGDYAYTVIDADSDVDERDLKERLNFEGIISVRVIK